MNVMGVDFGTSGGGGGGEGGWVKFFWGNPKGLAQSV